MYRTLLGEKGFKDGMKLYFKRHDGGAVTCDDFRAAMAGRLVYNHQPVWVTDLYSTVPTSSHPFRRTLRCRLLSSWELYSTLLYSTLLVAFFYSTLFSPFLTHHVNRIILLLHLILESIVHSVNRKSLIFSFFPYWKKRNQIWIWSFYGLLNAPQFTSD